MSAELRLETEKVNEELNSRVERVKQDLQSRPANAVGFNTTRVNTRPVLDELL